MKERLSIDAARKLVLLSQRVLAGKRAGSALDATRSAIEHLGYVQIDAISVVERAHHHTLWNRNARYESCQLEELLKRQEVFEYWSHAAAYLPMRDYRFSLRRKEALRKGELDHWYERDEAMMELVLRRIEEEGPLMAKDFENGGKRGGEWKQKPAKTALEYLFMQGDLMVPRRVNFHKVYDLPQRVLPGGIDVTPPTEEEYGRFLIVQYLRANGLGQAAEVAYLLKGVRPLVVVILKEMVLAGEVRELEVGGVIYYALAESLELLGKPLARRKLKILSPFDNLVIQRKRMKALFDFDYLIECYVPEAKRRYGYFSLPILWDGKLVARMDCKVERKEALLHLQNFVLEAGVLKIEGFLEALREELGRFLEFNRCDRLEIHRSSPVKFKADLRSALKELMG